MTQVLSGTQHLLEGLRAYFRDNGVSAKVGVGVRELGRVDNQGQGGANRVIVTPFDPKSGSGGRILDPMNVGPRDIYSDDDPDVRVATVRALGDWERSMSVTVWARDNDAPEDEERHTYAVETLLEQTKRAIDAVGLADVTWGATTWIVPPERHFGIAVQVGLTFRHPIFDRPDEVGYPGFDVTRTGEQS